MVLVVVKDSITNKVINTSMCNDDECFKDIAKNKSVVGKDSKCNSVLVQFFNVDDKGETLIEQHELFTKKYGQD